MNKKHYINKMQATCLAVLAGLVLSPLSIAHQGHNPSDQTQEFYGVVFSEGMHNVSHYNHDSPQSSFRLLPVVKPINKPHPPKPKKSSKQPTQKPYGQYDFFPVSQTNQTNPSTPNKHPKPATPKATPKQQAHGQYGFVPVTQGQIKQQRPKPIQQTPKHQNYGQYGFVPLATQQQKPSINYRHLMKQLKKNQNKWYAKRLKHYRFIMQTRCFCAPKKQLPINVIVNNSRVSKAHTHNGLNMKHHAKTINQLFAIIRNAINKKAYKIRVSYHPKKGFPTSLFIDQNSAIADDNITITVRALKNTQKASWNRPNTQKVTYCGRSRPRFCTREYRPTCGIKRDAKQQTYSNQCTACSDPNVIKYTAQACR